MREKASENGITANNASKEQEMMEMIFAEYRITHSRNIFEKVNMIFLIST